VWLNDLSLKQCQLNCCRLLYAIASSGQVFKIGMMATFQNYYEWDHSRMSETFGHVKLHSLYQFCFNFDFIRLINSVVCQTVCWSYIRRRGRILKLERSSCSFELLRSVAAFIVYLDKAICIMMCLSYYFASSFISSCIGLHWLMNYLILGNIAICL